MMGYIVFILLYFNYLFLMKILLLWYQKVKIILGWIHTFTILPPTLLHYVLHAYLASAWLRLFTIDLSNLNIQIEKSTEEACEWEG